MNYNRQGNPFQQNTDLEAIQLLKEGLLGEQMAIRGYEMIRHNSGSGQDKELITSILRDERRHYFLLQEIFEERTDTVFEMAKASISMPMDFIDMIKTAICDELEAVAFYERLAGMLDCMRQKEIVLQILNDEKEHAQLLAGLYQRTPENEE